MNLGKKRIYNTYYQDREGVILWKVIDINQVQSLRLRFLSTNSSYRQGVGVAIDQGTEKLLVNGIRGRGVKHRLPPVPKPRTRASIAQNELKAVQTECHWGHMLFKKNTRRIYRTLFFSLIIFGSIGLFFNLFIRNEPPDRYDIGKSVEDCSVIDFGCDNDDYILFNDETGCGCQKGIKLTNIMGENERKYYSTSLGVCEGANYSCERDWKSFEDKTGCGCER